VSVLFGGSRSLPASFAPLVSRVVGAVLAGPQSVSVGCAAGADALALSAALAALPGSSAFARLALFCVGSASGSGFWSGSAPWSLLSAAAARCRVFWFAGGGPEVPFRARLLRRSLAALAGCSSAVFFLSSPSSSGSLSVAAAAVRAGQPVFVFSCGFSGPPAPLSSVPAGSWSPSAFLGFPCWSWVPTAAQLSLF